jgi:two-component system NtrC family sensor kinase
MQEDEFKVRISIFHKIVLYATLLVFIAVGMSTYLAVKGEAKVLREGLVHAGRNMASNMGASTKSAFWSLNWIFVENMLKESVQDGLHQVICAKVVKPKGEVYLASERACYGERVDISLLSGRETLLENHFFPERNEHGILLIHPVAINGEKWHVILGLSLKSVKEAIRSLIIRNAAFGGLIVLLGIIGSLFLSKSISRPIINLANAAKTISAGNWNHNVTIQSRDEVGLLSHFFDRMLQSLKRGEEALKESEERYRDIFENVSDFLYFHDLEGHLIETNLAWKKEYGFTKDDFANLNLRDLLPDRYKHLVEDYLKRVKEHGKDEGLMKVVTKDGSERIVEYRNSLVYDLTAPIGVRGSARDITEAKRAEEKLKEYSQNLEKMVEERTVELKKTLHDLQNTQSQLIQSEKMASIGQLAAGVAHEINNPTGFVSSNLKTLSDYQNDIFGLIREYRKLIADLKQNGTSQANPAAIQGDLGRIAALEKEMDIDFIMDDTPNLIKDCQEGTERVKKIVIDLKDFAHPSEQKPQYADINQNLDSTLNIVWNELKYKATVTKEYGELPQVHCYPQQLNQVFMNLLVNAAQAIEKEGEIRISTQALDGHVEIKVSDTGSGIPKENLSRIFDPFFTTKEVGKGTGLGLNVAYNIIQKHKGTIDVESEVGKGTTFIIRLQVEAGLESNENQEGG